MAELRESQSLSTCAYRSIGLVRRLTLTIACVLSFAIAGCEGPRSEDAARTQQAIDAAKTKGDALIDANRYLQQMTPLNRSKVELEVQLHLNKWWMTADKSKTYDLSPQLIDGLPPDLRSDTAFGSTGEDQFTIWDVEYLYQCRLYRQLSEWIMARPLRDKLLATWLDQQAGKLPSEEHSSLELACKLFDWTMRNVVINGNAKDVESLPEDPRKPVVEAGLGYKYLPWQCVLYGRGDFIERGRVFTAMAQQRGLQTCWISLRLPSSPAPKLWAIGVLAGDNCYVFETKLGMPVPNPDTGAPVTITELQKDERILRRLDIPGRFDYAVNPGDLAKIEYLIEVEPSASSNRMTSLQASLTGADRLVLQPDVTTMQAKLKKIAPDAPVYLWQMPMLARLYATEMRSRLQMNSPFTASYTIEHAVWLLNTPSANARLKHLMGEFENTFDTRGALSTYMDCRVPDETIAALPDDPDVQKAIGIPRESFETMEEYRARLVVFQNVFRQAKVDANFFLAQLHYDIGNYSDVEGWLTKRTLQLPQASKWHAAAHYMLGRVYAEQDRNTEAIKEFNADNTPLEAGNRLRVRFLSK